MNPYEFVKSENPYIQEVIFYYKISLCPTLSQKQSTVFSTLPKQCSQLGCFYYHSEKERRRPVFDETTHNLCYSAYMCPTVLNNAECLDGNACKFCHTQNEFDFHPFNYKTESCYGCDYENNPRLCPRLHPEETSRKLSLERFQAKKIRELSGKKEEADQAQIFDLDHFKTQPCQSKGNHNPKFCYYYHHEKDRRRQTSIYNYCSEICKKVEKGQECPDGDNCRFCHNKVEQLYHPDRYKRKFCTFHPHKIDKCEYGNYCSFAHSSNEILIELLHNLKQDTEFYLYKYKTVFCPYIYDHDRSQCVYAHNAQDYRRNPAAYKYDPVQCPHWSNGPIYSYEEGGCSKGYDCDKCHGWKELEFHPFYFKTKPCSNSLKCTKKDCPFYHSSADKRVIDPSQKKVSEFFRNSKTSQLNNYQNSFQGNSFTTPTKPTQNFNIDEEKSNTEPALSKKPFNKKNTNYPIPVMPIHGSFNLRFDDLPQEKEKPKKKTFTDSTRPNSGISSTTFSEDDGQEGHRKSHLRPNGRKSAEPLIERNPSPLSTGSTSSDKTGNTKNKVNYKQVSYQRNIWSAMGSEDKPFEDPNAWESPKIPNKLDDEEDNINDAYFDFFTNDKIFAGTKMPNPKDEQFKNNLINKLKAKDLAYAIPYLINNETNIESLKNFGQKDYAKYPQITEADKDKIAMMIGDMLYEESVWAEINTVNGETSSNFESFNDSEDQPRGGSYDSHLNNLLKSHSTSSSNRKYSGYTSH